jgi:hypothetical protein
MEASLLGGSKGGGFIVPDSGFAPQIHVIPALL